MRDMIGEAGRGGGICRYIKREPYDVASSTKISRPRTTARDFQDSQVCTNVPRSSTEFSKYIKKSIVYF